MKKILFTLTVGCLSLSAFSGYAFAQNSVNPIAFKSGKDFNVTIRNLAAMDSPSFLGTNVSDAKSISSKALKDFQGRFNEAGSAMWFSDENGFESTFVRDGYIDRVFYNKKGRWQYSLIFYNENKLPRDLRSIVRSNYYDLNITLVEEVQTPDGNAYFVHLEDNSTIKIVKLNQDGEMEIVQDLVKE